MNQHKNTGLRYSSDEKAAAVRMVRTLRAELGTSQGTVKRVAEQLHSYLEDVPPAEYEAMLHAGVTSAKELVEVT